MDITLIQKDIIKIKGKHSAVVIGIGMFDSEALRTKTAADAVLLLKRNGNFDFSKVEEQRLFIKGPGEYEISGIKISSSLEGEDLCYEIQMDGLQALVSSTDLIKSNKEKIKGSKAAILYVNSDIDQSLITVLESNILLLYGEKAGDALKILNKEVKPVQKFSITPEKLPEEMEVVHLDS
ncbi:MAG: hypothetical protein Q7K55_03350 [Candidatus Levybacteria bacterium]|nr:hypothetical protein [Candidatus Levybacteria bacterium]